MTILQDQIIRPAVVASAGNRDQYQLPLAFSEAGILERFVTDFYFPADQPWFKNTIGRFLREDLIRKRFEAQLDTDAIQVDTRALYYFVSHFFTNNVQQIVSKDIAISMAARRLASKYGTPLVCHSYYGFEAFQLGDDRPEYRFLVQLHPHPVSTLRILSEELALTPMGRNSLMREPDIRNRTYQFERLSEEPHLANGWITASSFTKQTLIENGIPDDCIHVVPYGVDTSAFVRRPKPPPASQPFTIVFVGQIIQRKGLSYLFEAIKLLKTQQVQLVLCGRGFVDEVLLSHYRDLNVEININLSLPLLLDKLHRSHVFVLPSLVEGFGHVIVEAMATGLPVIITPHTGGVDLITEGREGFIVPIRSAEAIAEKLAWAIEHQTELNEMGEQAADRAQKQTWKGFRLGIVEAYRQLLGNLLL